MRIPDLPRSSRYSQPASTIWRQRAGRGWYHSQRWVQRSHHIAKLLSDTVAAQCWPPRLLRTSARQVPRGAKAPPLRHQAALGYRNHPPTTTPSSFPRAAARGATAPGLGHQAALMLGLLLVFGQHAPRPLHVEPPRQQLRLRMRQRRLCPPPSMLGVRSPAGTPAGKSYRWY
jgi:hypothetical protein